MTTTVRLTTFSHPSVLVAARYGGFLEEAGIVLHVDDAKGSRPQIEGLLAGRWDIAHTNADNIMRFRAQGHDELFIFLVADRGIAQKLVVHPDVTWDDLRGGALGVDAPDSGYALVLYELLRRHGLPTGSYRVVPLGATVFRLEGLRRGEIAGGLLSHHHEANALDEGFRVLADTHDHFPDHAGVTAASTRPWSERHPDLLRSYTRALTRAARWAQDPANADDVAALMAGARGISPHQAHRLLAIERDGRTAGLPSAEEAARSLRAVSDLRASVTGDQPRDYFDPSYMRAALDATEQA